MTDAAPATEAPAIDDTYARSGMAQPETTEPAAEVAPAEAAEAPAPEAEAQGEAAPAEPTVEEQLAELAEIKRLLKESPEQLAKKYELELFSTKFGKLAKKSAAIRAQEKAIQQQAQQIEQAQDLVKKIEADPIAFVQEKFGTGAYKEWTKRILQEAGQEVTEEQAKAPEPIDQEKLINSAKEAALAEFKAQQFLDSVTAAVSDEAHPAITARLSTDQIHQAIVALDAEAREKGLLHPGQLLPVGEALDILEQRAIADLRKSVDSDGIRKALGLGVDVATPTEPVVERAEENQGPATLTSELQSGATREVTDEGDETLSDSERIKRIVAKFG